ncbi:5-formyltetrahydrofolate cyclo-ligase [Desulfogranum japonicum]|uniref:5-formyltetrahydrofolate cyclo-ligase n=1 Tax=Desulfogranum japonicum TaxID=231447 RepID=UPI0004064C56|nr:5-formyltetrahydrofolate cyclo-ligase [Desulfogranum japonicum]
MMSKERLRKDILLLRDNLSPLEQEQKSRRINNILFSSQPYIQAESVFTYLHFRSEVQTSMLVEKILLDNKRLYVPKVDPVEHTMEAVEITDPVKDLTIGYMGIAEPGKDVGKTADSHGELMDLIVVPGAVFDIKGNRIGYGGGFYDKFFSKHSGKTFRLALAYDLQIVSSIPVETHDVPMDCLVSEDNIFFFTDHIYENNSCIQR